MRYTDILVKYDLSIDCYELRMSTGMVKTISLLANGDTVYTDVYVNGKAMTDDRAVKMFDTIVNGDFAKVKVLSKNSLSRRQRENRRTQDRIVYDYDPEEYIDHDRYDNHIVSELLPNLSISLYDLIMTSDIDVKRNGAQYCYSNIA